MDGSSNPFERAYGRFTITRILLVDQRNADTLHRRWVHATQADLTDSDFTGKYCKCDDEFAFIPENGDYPPELLANLPYAGYIVGVVYSVAAANVGFATHIGDTPNKESAEALVSRLCFPTDAHSRCCEVSSEHIPYWSRSWMKQYVRETIQPPEVFFQAYEIPNPRKPYSLGFRLQNTPWTDEHLSTLGNDSQKLREAQETIEIPEPIIDILHLAANANTRILIFDPVAPVLAGLPLASRDQTSST